jgi:hypothetical protein
MKISRKLAIWLLKYICRANTRDEVLSSEFEAFLGEINKVKVEEMIDILENGSYSLEYGVLNGDKRDIIYARNNISKENIKIAIDDFSKNKANGMYLSVYRHHYGVEIVEDSKTCVYGDKYWGGK